MIEKEKRPSKYSKPEDMCREVDISSQFVHLSKIQHVTVWGNCNDKVFECKVMLLHKKSIFQEGLKIHKLLRTGGNGVLLLRGKKWTRDGGNHSYSCIE